MRPPIQQRGFTLIEALISLTILAIGLAGAARFQAYTLAQSRAARVRAEAMLLAQTQAEQLRHFATRTQYDQLPPRGQRRTAGRRTQYFLNWSLTQQKGMDFKILTINIHWPNQTGPHHYRLQTLIAGQEPARSGWRLH